MSDGSDGLFSKRLRACKSSPQLETPAQAQHGHTLRRTNSTLDLAKKNDNCPSSTGTSNIGTSNTGTSNTDTFASRNKSAQWSKDCSTKDDTCNSAHFLNASDTPEPYKLHTRAHMLRHVVGFRKYNYMVDLGSQLLEMCQNVAAILEHRQTALQHAIVKVDRAIERMQNAEFNFFREFDKVLLYEQKSHELNFLKRNIERCIQTSVGAVKSQLPETSIFDNPEYARVKDALLQPWPDHNQFRAMVAHLQEYLRVTGDSILHDHHSRSNNIRLEINGTTALVEKCFQANSLKRLIDAGENLESLQAQYYRLEPIQAELQRSIQQSQIITKSLIFIATEAARIEKVLCMGAETMRANPATPRLDRILQEECTLLEFIYNGYESQRQLTSCAATQGGTDKSSVNRIPKFRSMTPLNDAGPSNHTAPVWTQSWAHSCTRIHKSKLNKMSNY